MIALSLQAAAALRAASRQRFCSQPHSGVFFFAQEASRRSAATHTQAWPASPPRSSRLSRACAAKRGTRAPGPSSLQSNVAASQRRLRLVAPPGRESGAFQPSARVRRRALRHRSSSHGQGASRWRARWKQMTRLAAALCVRDHGLPGGPPPLNRRHLLHTRLHRSSPRRSCRTACR